MNKEENSSSVVPRVARRGTTTKLSGMVETLLDSSLIVTTNNKKLYNVKLVDCGDYVQVYYLQDKKLVSKKDNDELNLQKINTSSDCREDSNYVGVELKNIIRSKLECQRLAKCNANDWKTFITLTYKENVTNIDDAKKDFRYFIDKVQRVYKDLKYICIPEFQKRGAVHFHLLTNIDINNEKLICLQENNKKFKHIKYWNKGFTKVDTLEKDIKKIIGYISKYMTKDIDNRLYNRHRYYYSRNLNKPVVNYLDFSNTKHLEYYSKKLKNKNLIYENEYKNVYNNEKIAFKEFL